VDDMTEFDLYMNKKNYINSIGYVYQPTIATITSLGEEYYNDLIKPFSYTLDILDEEFLETHPNISKNFDIFFLRYDTGEVFLYDTKNNKSFLDLLVEAFKLFTQKNVYFHNEYQAIVIGDEDDSKIIHRDNFDEIADYVLKINNTARITIEKLPKFQNDRQRDVYTKLMAGRRRNAEQKSLSLAEIIKYVRHGGKSIISYSEIYEMHIYQLYEDYQVISKEDFYEKEFGKMLAGADPKDLQLQEHWIYQVKNKD
jgi:hypothetical protein